MGYIKDIEKIIQAEVARRVYEEIKDFEIRIHDEKGNEVDPSKYEIDRGSAQIQINIEEHNIFYNKGANND